LDFSTPDTALPVGLRDGNNPSFRQAISGTIAGLSIPPGATFWIRWSDFNASGADDGLAVDDVSITPQQSVGPSGTGSATPSIITAGQSTTLRVAVTKGIPPAPIASVVANLTAIGGSAAQAFTDDGTNVNFSFVATVPLNIAGSFSLPVAIAEAGVGGRTG